MQERRTAARRAEDLAMKAQTIAEEALGKAVNVDAWRIQHDKDCLTRMNAINKQLADLRPVVQWHEARVAKEQRRSEMYGKVNDFASVVFMDGVKYWATRVLPVLVTIVALWLIGAGPTVVSIFKFIVG